MYEKSDFTFTPNAGVRVTDGTRDRKAQCRDAPSVGVRVDSENVDERCTKEQRLTISQTMSWAVRGANKADVHDVKSAWTPKMTPARTATPQS